MLMNKNSGPSNGEAKLQYGPSGFRVLRVLSMATLSLEIMNRPLELKFLWFFCWFCLFLLVSRVLLRPLYLIWVTLWR